MRHRGCSFDDVAENRRRGRATTRATAVEHEITDGAASAQITLPTEPGVYELRFLDVASQAVLARKPITVE